MQALRKTRRFLRGLAIGLAVTSGLFGLIQLVPYGNTEDNPPVIAEPPWDHPRTRELAKRACFDCHSNETRWPWYSKIAPFSWVMRRDIDAARSIMNFSEWHRPWMLSHQAGSEVIRREMPPRSYRLLHGDADLTHEEKIALADGLRATFGQPQWGD